MPQRENENGLFAYYDEMFLSFGDKHNYGLIFSVVQTISFGHRPNH